MAFAFLAVMAFGTMPSPLYGLHRQRDHFSLFTVTVALAVHAVGVIVALLVGRHLSELYGPRARLRGLTGHGRHSARALPETRGDLRC